MRKLLLLICSLPSCLFIMTPAGKPRGYVFGRSQSEVEQKIFKRALEECGPGELYYEYGTGAMGLIKGSYWCTTTKGTTIP